MAYGCIFGIVVKAHRNSAIVSDDYRKGIEPIPCISAQAPIIHNIGKTDVILTEKSVKHQKSCNSKDRCSKGRELCQTLDSLKCYKNNQYAVQYNRKPN